MFSYTGSIKDRVEPSVYNHGLRIYLQGGVGAPKNLLLDNWRQYTVIDRNYYHEVKLPLLHLALDQTRFKKSFEALSEVATCDCEYFLQYGVCRHIVGVMASLEKEFNVSAKLQNTIPKQEEILDSIFTAQKVKLHRKWIATHDALMQSTNNNYYQLDKITRSIKEEPGQHDDFFALLSTVLEPYVGRYIKEKRILKIATESILIGKYQFWNFYMPLIKRFDRDLLAVFWSEMWKFYWMGACEGYTSEVLGQLVELNEDQKQSILEELIKNYGTQKEVYQEFCFAAKYYRYLIKHKEGLSEQDLVRLTEYVPDLRESTDLVLSGHLKTWSDFLRAGEYQEFMNIINLWADKLGKSEVFVETLKYIIRSHSKKKSLVNKLQDLI